MILLAIYGSPRKNGNTDLMMDSFLDGALSAANPELQKIYVRNLNISGCLACGYCEEHGTCVQQDDMQKVYPLLGEAERIVIASPVFFYGLSGQTKLLVDRSQAAYMRRYKQKTELAAAGTNTGRKGYFLCAGATRGRRLFEGVILTVRYFFDAIGVEYSGETCLRGLDEKGAIRNRPDALEECRRAGMAFVGNGQK